MQRRGISHLGLCIIICIVAITIAAVAPMVLRFQEAHLRIGTINRLKELGLACHSYNDQHKKLPPIHTGKNTVHIPLAPYYNFDASLLVSPADYSIRQPQPAMDEQAAVADGELHPGLMTSFSANYYVFGGNHDAQIENLNVDMPAGFGRGYKPLAIHTIRDGSSNTLIFVTALAQFGEASTTSVSGPASLPNQPTSPLNAAFSWVPAPDARTYTPRVAARAESFAAVGIQIALADGSGRTIVFDQLSEQGPWPPKQSEFADAMLPSNGNLPNWDCCCGDELPSSADSSSKEPPLIKAPE